MTLRKSVIIGCLILAGAGALLIGVFGLRIYHQYVWGGTTFVSGRASVVHLVFFTVRYGVYVLYVAVGLVCFATSVFLAIYYRRRLFGRQP